MNFKRTQRSDSVLYQRNSAGKLKLFLKSKTKVLEMKVTIRKI
jgi:hypothetical protein